MPILDHLGELRRRLIIMVISILLTSVVLYFATPTIIDMLLEPIQRVMPQGSRLTVLTALGGFTVRFKVAFFFGVIVSSPLVIWEVMGFFLPALNPHERRWVLPTLLAMVVLFFLGMLFCYVVILQAAFGWMLSQSSEFALVLPDAENFLGIMMLLEVGFGFAFQLPLIIFYLSILHIVPYKTFRNQWRFIYIGLMTLSAAFTPDASPITMMLMFIALVSLYEASLFVARRVIVARNGKAALSWSRQEFEEHQFNEYEA